MDKPRSHRWIRGWVMLVLLLMFGTLLLSPLVRAQTGPVRDIDQLRALAQLAQQTRIAASGPAIVPVGPRTVAAPRTAPKPSAAMEGPRQQPVRTNQGGPRLSLADRQKAKAGPRLTLSAQSGTPGSRITLRGRGYAPGQRINLFWDGANITERRLIVAAIDGTFDWPLAIPVPTTSGQHTVAALEATPAGAALAASTNGVATSSAAFTVVGGLPPGTSVAAPSATVAPVPTVVGSVTPQAVKPWTFAVYIAGDNSLSDYADVNIGQLAATGGTNANANIIVLKDVQNQPTSYLEVRNNSTVTVTPPSVTGNIDTGKPQPFIDFMTFIAANYPAQHYAVVIWNHGGGWTGIESDDPSGDIWDMTQLRTALGGGLQALGIQQYDAVLFDACLMGQYEVALQIADQTDVMTGSEEVIPGDGYPYDAFVSLLVNPPAGGATADALGAKIVEAYAAYYGPGGPRSTPKYTLSQFKLEGSVADLKAKVEAFATALLAVGSTSAGNIQAARDAADTYEYTTFIDLAGFASNVKTKLNDATVSAAADALLAALAKSPANTIQTESHGAEHSASTGLSIYLPAPSQNASFNAYGAVAGISGSKWEEFAKAFYTGQWPNTPAPQPGEDTPPPPPPAAASTSDIVYSSQVTSHQADLERVQSTADEDTSAETFALLSDGFNNTYPRWSYDGKFVVYASDRAADPDAKTGLETDLFLIKADGTPITGATGPVQLTSSQTICPDGPGTGTICTIEQSYDPSWLPSGAGLLYTRFSYDLTSPDSTEWAPLQSIHLIDLTKQPGQDGFDGQILPNAGLELGSDIQFANADFNGKFLMFTYRTNNIATYGADFVNNNIGFIDLEVDPAITRYFTLNTEDDIASGNYLITNYPAWRPNHDELAFLFTRVGDPPVLSPLDPRTPPPAGILENPYETYDIGDLNFAKDADGAYSYTMNDPLWTFVDPGTGEGVNLRPSWKPDDSGNLTASYSIDGGFTYNVGLFLNTGDTITPAERGFLITNDGYSTFPSWGTVTAADILARLEVKPSYLEPSDSSTYYLAGAGFSAGETVQVLRGTTAEAVISVVGSVQAGADGTFEVPFTLTKRTPPGPIYFQLQGSNKASNVGRLVVLTPRSVAASDQITPAGGGSVATTDGSIQFTFPPATVAQTTTLSIIELAGPSQPLPGNGNVLRSFKVTATDVNGQPVTQFSQPVTLVIKYTDAELADFPPITENKLVLRLLINGTWTDLPASVDTVANTLTATVDRPAEFAASESARARIFLPVVMR